MFMNIKQTDENESVDILKYLTFGGHLVLLIV